jgi:hypothetical protein
MIALTREAIDAFFQALAQRTPCHLKVILTGGAQAMLCGGTRLTRDIDFGLLLRVVPEKREALWEQIETAVAEAAQETSVTVQFAEDIDRWSSITMFDYQKHTRPYRRFGRVTVHLLDPADWAVPKLARSFDSDTADLIEVLRQQRVSPMKLARVCGKSLCASPRSTALTLFRRQVESFFREHGKAVWGEEFDADKAIAQFHRAARIRLRPTKR